jgi:hypothetical protein
MKFWSKAIICFNFFNITLLGIGYAFGQDANVEIKWSYFIGSYI